jgi:hypothetical protein
MIVHAGNYKFKTLSIIWFVGLLLFAPSLRAAEPGNGMAHKVWIMGVPQHLFQNGIRIEIDKPLRHSNTWLTIAPSMYYREKRGNYFFGNYNVHGVAGVGLDIYYRRYMSSAPSSGLYISAGGGYRFIRQKYIGDRWETFTEKGLSFYRYNNEPWYKKIHTANIRLVTGYQFLAAENFATDFFVGFGLRLSAFGNEDSASLVHSGGNYTNMSPNGIIVAAGVRIGVGW